jgi:hypothetical protein
MTAKNSCT